MMTWNSLDVLKVNSGRERVDKDGDMLWNIRTLGEA
jgi:hypothetical protein